jgi:hypothetical protein
MKYAEHLTDIKPTLGTVNGDADGSRFSSSVTSLTPSICTWITSFRSPLHKSMQFCKGTTVMAVVLTHYMKLNTIRTISRSIKTDNSCFVKIYWIATYKITETKKAQNRKLLFAEYNDRWPQHVQSSYQKKNKPNPYFHMIYLILTYKQSSWHMHNNLVCKPYVPYMTTPDLHLSHDHSSA